MSRRRRVSLASGRDLVIDRSSDERTERLSLRGTGGEVELVIEIGADGPKVRVRAIDVEIDAARALRLRCGSAEIRAAQDIRLVAGGDVSIESPRGTTRVVANDDVDLRGERILLNADTPPMPVHSDARAALSAGKVEP